MATTDLLLQMGVGIVKWIFYAIIFAVLVIPTWYYFFIVKNRRQWKAVIWEQRSDNHAVIVDKDTVIEKKIKKRNAHIYYLRKKSIAFRLLRKSKLFLIKVLMKLII